MAAKEKVSQLGDHLGYWLRFVSNHVSHAFQQKVEANGVTVAEWAVLRQMLESGPTNPSQIADQLGMTRGAISKLIERLHEKGLVEREAAEVDRRYQRVALSAKGTKLVPRLAHLADENDHEHFKHLSAKQRSELLGILRGLVERHAWKDIPLD